MLQELVRMFDCPWSWSKKSSFPIRRASRLEQKAAELDRLVDCRIASMNWLQREATKEKQFMQHLPSRGKRKWRQQTDFFGRILSIQQSWKSKISENIRQYLKKIQYEHYCEHHCEHYCEHYCDPVKQLGQYNVGWPFQPPSEPFIPHFTDLPHQARVLKTAIFLLHLWKFCPDFTEFVGHLNWAIQSKQWVGNRVTRPSLW